MRLAPSSAALLLAAAGTAALLADRLWAVGALAAALLAVVLRAPATRRWPYLVGGLGAGLSVFLLSPLFQVTGTHVLWEGPIVPVLGQLDVTREELVLGALNGLRLAAVALAFAGYALLLDHDRLLAAAGVARRSAFAAALAVRLVPTLERDGRALADAVRGRGVAVDGVRGRAALVSPLVGGSLERAMTLAEAMEARGFGRPGRTRAPRPGWRWRDRGAAALAIALVVAGALWL